MSWKSVEMQVALPRVQDAGKIQDQLLKQHQQFQDTLAQTHTKQQEIKRHQVNDPEAVRNNPDQFDEHHEDQISLPEENDKEQPDEESSVAHPYLGNHIDLSR